MTTMPITVQAHISVNGTLSGPLGTIELRERETAPWGVGALLREIADQVETHQPPIVISWD